MKNAFRKKKWNHGLAAEHTRPRLTHLWMDKMKYQDHRQQDMQ